MTSRQSCTIEKNIRFCTNFLNRWEFRDIWKVLSVSNWSHQDSGRDTTFIMGHALLKKAILKGKMAKGSAIFRPECILDQVVLDG